MKSHFKDMRPGDEIVIKRGALKDKKAIIDRIEKKHLRLILKEIGMVVMAKTIDLE